MVKVNVPLIGSVPRGAVIGTAVVGFGAVGYMYYRAQKKKSQAAAAAAAQSAAQASAAYGMVGAQYAYGYGAYPGGYYGYGEPGITYGYGASGGFAPQGYYGYGTVTGQQGGGGIPNTTNAQWAQAAINQLSGEGYDPMTVSQTLGAYELGQPVSAANEGIVQAAIGIEGYPPQSGASGYPPAINVQGTTGGGSGGGQGGGGGGGGNTVIVPSVVGDRADNARQTLRRAGLAYSISNNAQGSVTKQSPAGGATATKGSKVTLTLKK